MLWIALHLPRLALEALPHQAAQPCAVMQHALVHTVNEAAAALGVRAGQTAATALALAPALRTWERDAVREAARIEALGLALLRFTPTVVLRPDGVLLEVQASLRLFGGIRQLRRAVSLLAARHAQARLALAPTPGGAALLAQAARRRHALQLRTLHRLLDAMPQAALASVRHSPGLRQALWGLGCRRLQDLQALPRAGLQRRFGAALLQELDRAYGKQPDPQPLYEAPPHFEQRLELMARADTTESLMPAAQRLLDALCGWLAARWSAVRAVRLLLVHEKSQRLPAELQRDTVLNIALAQPSRDPAHLATLLAEKLGRGTLPAAAYELVLVADEVVSHAGENTSWLPDPAHQGTSLMRLVDRLQARLGRENVHRLEKVADARPERATRRVPVQAVQAIRRGAESVVESADNTPCWHPAWLLPQPVKLAARAHRPLYPTPLKLLTRPERIEWGWFDGGLVQRDYYVAENDDHALLWIYRERGLRGQAGWFLHGLFG